jgi:hypothetical protein
MFSTQGQDVKQGGGIPKSLQAGVVYAHIHSAQVRESKNTGKKALELVLEGSELENFEGWLVDRNDENGPKFKGQSSKVMATTWTDQHNEPNVMKNEIMYKLTVIADQLGVREDVNKVSAESLEEWVAKTVAILKGNYAYFFLKGTEEEYNGKTIIKLSLPKYKFVALDEARLDKFDKNNKYHYKALENKTISGFEPAGNDDFSM